jgi:hypothetical protein
MAVEDRTAIAAADRTARDTAKQYQFFQQKTGTADSQRRQPFFIGVMALSRWRTWRTQPDSAAMAHHSFRLPIDCFRWR